MSNAWTDPEHFLRRSSAWVRLLYLLFALVAAVALFLGLFVCPVDAVQGQSYRILFIHVASAWMSMLIYVLMALFCIVALAFEREQCSVFAAAMAPTGALMAFLALVTGSLWGRPTWGTYWVWDARLTSELVLLFLYVGFLALQSAIDDARRADKACGLIAIVGVVNVPIIYFSVKWWNTLHQGASITSKGSSIAPMMLTALLVMVAAFTIYGFASTIARARAITIERSRRAEWLQNQYEEGKL